MKIIYTDHARQRMKQRKILQRSVKEVFAETTYERVKNEVKMREYNGLVVVYKEHKGDMVVITAYRPDRDLEEKISIIPKPHPWYNMAAQQAFEDQAYWLLDKGFDEEEVIDHLTKMYYAVVKEFEA